MILLADVHDKATDNTQSKTDNVTHSMIPILQEPKEHTHTYTHTHTRTDTHTLFSDSQHFSPVGNWNQMPPIAHPGSTQLLKRDALVLTQLKYVVIKSKVLKADASTKGDVNTFLSPGYSP